jgi:ADP-ribose pyrophosphatase YjhB (NUDIX family)
MAGSITLLFNLMANIWNGLGAPLRRWLAWLAHAKYIHGVAGVIMDERGRVLLLKHRFWKEQRWGLPGGLARPGETLAATLRRELREETGLDVRPSKLLRVNVSRGRLSQFVLLAECAGEPRAISPEIIDARFWEPAELPDNLLQSHRELIEAAPGMPAWPGLPLEE